MYPGETRECIESETAVTPMIPDIKRGYGWAGGVRKGKDWRKKHPTPRRRLVSSDAIKKSNFGAPDVKLSSLSVTNFSDDNGVAAKRTTWLLLTLQNQRSRQHLVCALTNDLPKGPSNLSLGKLGREEYSMKLES